MAEIIWGETHCIFCEKLIATEENENQYDWLTKYGEWEESDEYWDKYCWSTGYPCGNYEPTYKEHETDTYERRIIELLNERNDLLRIIAEQRVDVERAIDLAIASTDIFLKMGGVIKGE